jgi:hypothetical protein
MHTLIARWHKLPSKPVETADLKVAMDAMREWCIPIIGMTTDQITSAYLKKKQQLDEMNQQFQTGEKTEEGIGLIRVDKGLEDRVGSWPPWLWEIVAKKMDFDPINKQFFMKHPDDKKLLSMNVWISRLKSSPMRYFAMRYPATFIRNFFNLGALSRALLADTQYFEVAAIDMPEKGEDGYYHFRDDFWTQQEPEA